MPPEKNFLKEEGLRSPDISGEVQCSPNPTQKVWLLSNVREGEKGQNMGKGFLDWEGGDTHFLLVGEKTAYGGLGGQKNSTPKSETQPQKPFRF